MTVLISRFRNRALVEVPGCPIPMIDTYVLNSIRKMCEDTYAYTKAFEAADQNYALIDATDNDSFEIDLSAYFSDVDPVAPLMLQIDGADYGLSELVLENDNTNLSSIEISSVKFFNFPDLTTIKLFPFTGQSVNFDIFLRLAVKPTRGELSVEDKFYNNDDWYEGIIHLAASMLQMIPGRPWSNEPHGALNKSIYSHHMGRVKIDAAVGGTAGSFAIQGGYF